ncbi:MAG: PHB depolymerase family esterase [Candidatus Bipolaricaulia bacterium]
MRIPFGLGTMMLLGSALWALGVLAGSLPVDPSSSQVSRQAASNAPGWHEGTLAHDGLERRFRFYVPSNLARDAPTVVLLHGGTQSMDKLFERGAGGTQEWPEIAEEEGFPLLVPNGTNTRTGAPTGDRQRWNDCRSLANETRVDDVGFVIALADWAVDRFHLASEKLAVTGASNGGMMAYRLAIERPDRIAAIAAFIANLPQDGECPDPSEPVPVFIANGTADPLMPYAGGTIANGRGQVHSAEKTRDMWIDANDADPSRRTVQVLPNRDPNDGSRIVCEDYPEPETGSAVRFCRVAGGGHTMPSREHRLPRGAERVVGPQNHDMEGARLAWAFLRQALTDSRERKAQLEGDSA